MKKIMTLAVVACMALAANAQTWVVRAGVDVANVTGKDMPDDAGSRIGYYVGGEMQLPVITDGMYVSAGLGLKTKGYKMDSGGTERNMNHGALEIPVNIGYKIPLAEDFKFAVHGGVFCDFDLWGKTTVETGGIKTETKLGDYTDYTKFAFGFGVGGGIWFKQFNLDVTWQRALNKQMKDTKAFESNVLVTLGYAF